MSRMMGLKLNSGQKSDFADRDIIIYIFTDSHFNILKKEDVIR